MLRRQLQSSLVPQLQQLQQQQLRELTIHTATKTAGRGSGEAAALHTSTTEDPQEAQRARGHPLLQNILRTDLAAEVRRPAWI